MAKILTSFVIVGLAVGVPLAAQQASFTPFGTGCATPNERLPRIGNRGVPRLGTTMTVTYSGPNTIQPGIQLTDQPILVFGLSRVDAPFPPVGPLQPSGCTLYPFPDAAIPMPPDSSGTRYVSEMPLAVPNDPTLLGGTLFLQWLTPHSQCFFVGCGLRWVVASDAARLVVGS